MSNEMTAPESTWKCGSCGTLNKFENTTCALCKNPRPADAAASSASPWTAAAKATGFPSALYVLVVYEALAVLYWLYSVLVITPHAYRQMQSMMSKQNMGGPGPDVTTFATASMAVGIALGLIWLALRAVMVYGWFMRRPWARVFGIVRYALSIAGGLMGVASTVMMLFALSSMRGQPGPGGMPMDRTYAQFANPALNAAIALITLGFGIVGVCFLTTTRVKEYFNPYSS